MGQITNAESRGSGNLLGEHLSIEVAMHEVKRLLHSVVALAVLPEARGKLLQGRGNKAARHPGGHEGLARPA